MQYYICFKRVNVKNLILTIMISFLAKHLGVIRQFFLSYLLSDNFTNGPLQSSYSNEKIN